MTRDMTDRPSTPTKSDPRIVVALDFPSPEAALAFLPQLDPVLCRLKVGFELFLAGGPAFVEGLQAKGFEIFLDLKFHDIPNTVAAACRVASSLGVWMINVHASGGSRMMEAAAEAVAQASHSPLLIAVTVLTSMDQRDLKELGIGLPPEQQVLHLAGLAKNSGMDGVVCSAHEASALREQQGSDFVLVTPGIRPAGSDQGDQRRIMTPAEALAAGSHYLVIGRPITKAQSPLELLTQISVTLQ